MLIFDAHLDLSMNALEWNRDLTHSVTALRERESGMTDKPDRSRGTVSLPEMRQGQIGLCVATLIARVEHNAYSPVFGWRSQPQAWAQTQGQLAWYNAMEEMGEMAGIRNQAELNAHLKLWNSSTPESQRKLPVGFILSLEGADSILSLHHLERAWNNGLRALGPAHYGPGVYANGTNATGGFNPKGRELLGEMERLGLILDLSHLSDDCFSEALHSYRGPLWASHSNCRSLVPHQRQFSDEQIQQTIARGGVIGAALDAWMIIPNWVRGKTTPQSTNLTLEHLCNHIDHICQLAGNALHCGLGSDLDGAFGTEQTPTDINTIADLQKLQTILARRGYTPTDIENILHGNFIRFLQQNLPA